MDIVRGKTYTLSIPEELRDNTIQLSKGASKYELDVIRAFYPTVGHLHGVDVYAVCEGKTPGTWVCEIVNYPGLFIEFAFSGTPCICETQLLMQRGCQCGGV